MIEPGLLNILGAMITFPMAAIVLIAGLRGRGRKPYLALVFLEAGLFFLIDIFRGIPVFSLILSLSVAFLSMPALYLFSGEVVGEPIRRPLRHFIPAIVTVPAGVCCALIFAANNFHGGVPAVVYICYLHLGQTVQIVFYGRASLALAARIAGTTGSRTREKGRGCDVGIGGGENTGHEAARTGRGDRGWLRRITLPLLGGYGLFILLSWVVFLESLAADFLGLRFENQPDLGTLSALTAVLVAWTVALGILWGKDFTSAENRKYRKYGGKPLSGERVRELVEKVRLYIQAEEDLSSPEVSPRCIAQGIGEPYYLVSRAVNETEALSLADLVNTYRVERVKELLERRPEMSILDAAFEAGFQSKSTFNDIFKKATGLSPRRYRAERISGGEG